MNQKIENCINKISRYKIASIHLSFHYSFIIVYLCGSNIGNGLRRSRYTLYSTTSAYLPAIHSATVTPESDSRRFFTARCTRNINEVDNVIDVRYVLLKYCSKPTAHRHARTQRLCKYVWVRRCKALTHRWRRESRDADFFI